MAASAIDLLAAGGVQKENETEPENTRKQAPIMV